MTMHAGLQTMRQAQITLMPSSVMVLSAPTKVPDDFGGFTTQWLTQLASRARVVGRGGTRVSTVNQIQTADWTHVVTLPYDTVVGIGCRIELDDGRKLDVVEMLNAGDMVTAQRCVCKEAK